MNSVAQGGGLVPGGGLPRGVSNAFQGGSPIFWGVSNFGGGLIQFFFYIQIFFLIQNFFSNFFPPGNFFWDAPPSQLDTVTERPVRILLECILVNV